MQNVKEQQRHPSPGGRPQPLAFFNGQLWMGSWDTNKLYAIDPTSWSVAAEVDAPGKPFGLATFAGAFYVVVSDDEDDRYLYRFTPGSGFDGRTPCPDFTGSHLASNGTSLYLCQQGNQRILEIDAQANVKREIALPARCAGFNFDASGTAFMITADEEFEQLAFATIDLRESQPAANPVANVPFDVRALVSDGKLWWTSHREASEIIAFTV
jgi:DNA-binding beta-propeller fold protein YncE